MDNMNIYIYLYIYTMSFFNIDHSPLVFSEVAEDSVLPQSQSEEKQAKLPPMLPSNLNVHPMAQSYVRLPSIASRMGRAASITFRKTLRQEEVEGSAKQTELDFRDLTSRLFS